MPPTGSCPSGPGENRTPEYLALNPMGQVPVLRLPDGTVITESGAMLLAIADAAPASGLLPELGSPLRPVAYRWLFWLATGLYETDLRLYYADRYTADPAGATAVAAAARTRLDDLMGMAEGLLGEGPFVLGRHLSAVDIYLFMLTLWHPDRLAVLDRWPRLGALARTVRQRPAVAKIWAENYPPGDESPWSTWTGSNGP